MEPVLVQVKLRGGILLPPRLPSRDIEGRVCRYERVIKEEFMNAFLLILALVVATSPTVLPVSVDTLILKNGDRVVGTFEGGNALSSIFGTPKANLFATTF